MYKDTFETTKLNISIAFESFNPFISKFNFLKTLNTIINIDIDIIRI